MRGKADELSMIRVLVRKAGGSAEAPRGDRGMLEDGIAAFTPPGDLLTWNQRRKRVFSYSAGEAVSMQTVSVLAERPAGLANFVEQVMQGQTVSQYEGYCRCKDGRRIHVSVTGSPIPDADGEIVAISAVSEHLGASERAKHGHFGVDRGVLGRCDSWRKPVAGES